MAVAEAHLAATFNKPGHDIVDHYTYFICSDGDLMEGISHEAASFAGHFKLGKLIGFYDDNSITIDGSTDLTFTDDTAKRFEAYGWQVLHISDVNDLDQIEAAIAEAQADTTRPTLVVTRTHIGFGSPQAGQREGARRAARRRERAASPRRTSAGRAWSRSSCRGEALAHWRKAKDKGAKLHAEWNTRRAAYAKAYPGEAAELDRRLAGKRPRRIGRRRFRRSRRRTATSPAAPRSASCSTPRPRLLPELVGGSADLTPSNNTSVKAWKNFAPDDYAARYVHFGIREHGNGRRS